MTEHKLNLNNLAKIQSLHHSTPLPPETGYHTIFHKVPILKVAQLTWSISVTIPLNLPSVVSENMVQSDSRTHLQHSLVGGTQTLLCPFCWHHYHQSPAEQLLFVELSLCPRR